MAMRVGAYDYILKDDLCDELVLPVLNGLHSRRRLEQRGARAARAAAGTGSPSRAGWSACRPRWRVLRETIRRAALSDRPVLVTGPTGSGKELVVEALHTLGPHPDHPLLDVNCGAIPEALMESQLFGHAKGAFTGAEREQQGYLTLVKQGTLFLDEVAELAARVAGQAAAGARDQRVSSGRIAGAGPLRRARRRGDPRRISRTACVPARFARTCSIA